MLTAPASRDAPSPRSARAGPRSPRRSRPGSCRRTASRSTSQWWRLGRVMRTSSISGWRSSIAVPISQIECWTDSLWWSAKTSSMVRQHVEIARLPVAASIAAWRQVAVTFVAMIRSPDVGQRRVPVAGEAGERRLRGLHDDEVGDPGLDDGAGAARHDRGRPRRRAAAPEGVGGRAAGTQEVSPALLADRDGGAVDLGRAEEVRGEHDPERLDRPRSGAPGRARTRCSSSCRWRSPASCRRPCTTTAKSPSSAMSTVRSRTSCSGDRLSTLTRRIASLP